MKKTLIIFAAMFFIFAACANNNQKEPTTTASAQKEITVEEAKRYATIHLGLKKQSWGKPQSVSEEDGKFYLSYKTPERELRLIGQRQLIVDKRTGVVSYQKRR